MRPRLLDLFCGAGGCSVGYHHAGFDVTGMDIEDHPSYPYKFHIGDALLLVDSDSLDQYDVIHASPPCQVFTRAQHLRNAQGKSTSVLDLLTPLRPRLQEWAADTGGIYVIENVPGAPMDNPVQFCGSSFGLKVRRHRWFESNAALLTLPCEHGRQGKPVGVYGSMRDEIPSGGHTAKTIEEAREAMGIDWMRWRSVNQEWNDLKEAIPPAYTEHIGLQLIDHLRAAAWTC